MFQTMINTLFRDLIAARKMTVYMDNMAIHTKQEKGETEEDHTHQHQRIVNKVLHILDQYDLFLNLEKCDFELPYIDFLGVQVEEGKVQMEESKVNRVKSWTPPWNVTKVCQFLGFTGYYQYFIQGYSSIARPLLDLTKKTTPWHWNKDQQNAFKTLKNKMCSKPVLQQPDFDKMFYL